MKKHVFICLLTVLNVSICISSQRKIPRDIEIPLSISKKKFPEKIPSLYITKNEIRLNRKHITDLKNVTQIPKDNHDPVISALKKSLLKLWGKEKIDFKKGKISKIGRLKIYNHRENPFDILFKVMNTCGKAGYSNQYFITAHAKSDSLKSIDIELPKPRKSSAILKRGVPITLIISNTKIIIEYAKDSISRIRRNDVIDTIVVNQQSGSHFLELKVLLQEIRHSSAIYENEKDIIVAGENTVSYQYLIRTMDMCRSGGFTDIHIAKSR